MARTRKHTEKAVVTLEELPRAAEALTPEAAAAVRGGADCSHSYYYCISREELESGGWLALTWEGVGIELAGG